MSSFEVAIDNARMQIHCRDEKPPPTPGDYELVIWPTSVTSEGSTDSRHSPFVVGDTTNGLKDGLDTTYGWATWLRTVKGVYPLWDTLDPKANPDPDAVYPSPTDLDEIDSSWVNTIACRFRAKAVESDASFGIQLFAQASKLLTNPSYGPHVPLSFAASDTWENFEWGFTPEEYDTGGWAPNGILSALNDMSPGYLYVRTVPLDPVDGTLNDYNIQVSEQRLVLYYTVPEE